MMEKITRNIRSLHWMKVAVALVFCCAVLPAAKAQLPAFPGAEGFGKYTSGGRGGMVVEVTNVNDSGAGSLRWAVTQYPGQPLTVVFRVSGIIDLQSTLKITRSNFTIAGQTAPGDGICIKGNSVEINGAAIGGNNGNIIIRYMRFRPGAPIYLGATGMNLENVHDVIVDHCSFSWANEENAALYDTKNTTVQWCISSEGLYNAGHHKGSRSYSGVWGGQYATYHHNLVAHCNTRTIRFDGSRAHDTIALVDYRNNVVFNSHASGSCYGGEVEIPGGVSHANLVNNYYKPGPATPSSWVFVSASYPTSPTVSQGIGRWHMEGNIMTSNAAYTANNYLGLSLGSLPVADRPFARADTMFAIPAGAQVATQPADTAYLLTLANAGAILPRRDSVDRRIVNETRLGIATGTGSYPNGIPPLYGPSIGNGIIDTPSVVGGWPVYASTAAPADNDHDGMPDAWELCRGLNPNDPADRNLFSSTGYTNLEDYLNGMICNTPAGVGSVPGIGEMHLVLYPNPAHNELTVNFPAAKAAGTLTIFNVATGAKIASYKVAAGSDHATVNTAFLVSGQYGIAYESGSGRVTATFVRN